MTLGPKNPTWRRIGWVCAIVALAPSARAEGPKALYTLSSPDVGQAWHLHAKDGALVCELPCEAWVGASSGDYLVVHDAKKAWRVNLPSMADGAHVSMSARVGKGSPALGALGDVLSLGGAAAGLSGVALLLASLASFVSGCAATDPAPCASWTNAGTYAAIGTPLAIGGTILAVVGLYLSEHNKPASRHVMVTPTSMAVRF